MITLTVVQFFLFILFYTGIGFGLGFFVAWVIYKDQSQKPVEPKQPEEKPQFQSRRF